MNAESILSLFPPPVEEIPLVGAYLQHDIRGLAAAHSGLPYIYANFVVSLDGRIAITRKSGDLVSGAALNEPGPNAEELIVPRAIANSRDWRLFQELVAQADILLSSGRYLRDWAAGKAQEILQVDDPRYADLRQWRVAHGLPLHPDIAIISRSLDFSIPPVITSEARKAILITTKEAADKGADRLSMDLGSRLSRVIIAGDHSLDVKNMRDQLAGLGYNVIYSAAGPRILHLLASGGVLDRLYFTLAHRLLGGETYASLLAGSLLDPAIGMRINQILLDPYALDRAGQLFLSYDSV